MHPYHFEREYHSFHAQGYGEAPSGIGKLAGAATPQSPAQCACTVCLHVVEGNASANQVLAGAAMQDVVQLVGVCRAREAGRQAARGGYSAGPQGKERRRGSSV